MSFRINQALSYSQDGQALVEYALLMFFIAAVVVSFAAAADGVVGLYQDISIAVDSIL